MDCQCVRVCGLVMLCVTAVVLCDIGLQLLCANRMVGLMLYSYRTKKLVDNCLKRADPTGDRSVKFDGFLQMMCFAPLCSILPEELQPHILQLTANVTQHEVKSSQIDVLHDQHQCACTGGYVAAST